MIYYIGADGGGTKTAFEARGYESPDSIAPSKIKTSTSDALNYNFIGLDNAVKNFKDGFDALGIERDKDVIAAIAIGDPAIDDYPVSAVSLEFIRRISDAIGCGNIYVRGDAYMAKYSICGSQPGVSVISGTGAIGIAEDSAGNVYFAGGWGRLTGDEGSGYYIGLESVKAALAYADGHGKKTALLECLMKRAFGEGYTEKSPRQLIDFFYGDEVFDPSPLSKLTSDCALDGDEVADSILKDAARRLFDITDALCKKCSLDGDKVKVGVSGSVLMKDMIVRGEFERLIKEKYPLAKVVTAENSPQRAAAFYAREKSHDILINCNAETKA